MTLKQEESFLVQALQKFSEEPQVEASEILAHVLKINRNQLYFKRNEKISKFLHLKILKILRLRKKGLPLQYALGSWEFYSLPFKVGRGVLIPRQDTELVVDLLLEHLSDKTNPLVFDLCAGSGAIGIAAKKNCPNARVVMVEKSIKAYKYLTKNIKLNEINALALCMDIKKLKPKEKADIIVSNPPYITKKAMGELQKEVTFEPEMALYGGEDGLDFYKFITR